MPAALTDAELARRIASGGQEARAAEAALYARHAPRIRLYGRRHLSDPPAVEDLVQQALLRVLEALRAGRLQDPTALTSFVFGTCRHVAQEMQRARRRLGTLDAEPAQQVVEPPAHTQEEVLRLFACMGRLGEREATVVRMSFMEDRSTDEIAARLNVAAGNVRVIRCRALAKLASYFDAEEPR